MAKKFLFSLFFIVSTTCTDLIGGIFKNIDYLCMPDGNVVVSEKISGSRTTRYVHTDHLGSFRTIIDANKSIAARYHYDAWGKRSLITVMYQTWRWQVFSYINR